MNNQDKITPPPPNVKAIEVSKIITDGQMVRESEDDDHIAELALSIAKHGLLQPIVVTPCNDGYYQLQAGFHRLLAVKRLGWKHIEAHVRQDETGSTKNIAFVENLLRKQMTLEEEVKAVSYLHNEENMSIGQICEATGKSVAWVQKRLMIPNLPQEVKDELLEGRISVSHAEIIATLDDEGARDLVINAVVQQKLSRRQTEELVAIYKNTPSIGLAIDAARETEEKISQTGKIPQRTCDLCQRYWNLADMHMLVICPTCANWIKEMLIQNQEEEKNDNTGTN